LRRNLTPREPFDFKGKALEEAEDKVETTVILRGRVRITQIQDSRSGVIVATFDAMRHVLS
jgi:hypothetical protein